MELQRHHPLATLQEATNLYNRCQSGAGFRTYLKARINLVVAMGALVVLTSIACTAGTVVSLAGARAYLMLFALLLAPFILVGSLFVQWFLLFGWLENRALATGLGHRLEPEGRVQRWLRKQLHADLGKLPAIPWLFAAVFLLLPLLMTAAVAPKLAAALVLVYAGAVVLFARLDR
jgi:hypothetical protein